MIDWDSKKSVITEPPLTKHLTEEQLDNLATSGESSLVLTKMPCHSEAVERHLKLVTETAAKVCAEKARHEAILAKLKSIKKMPHAESKKDLKDL